MGDMVTARIPRKTAKVPFYTVGLYLFERWMLDNKLWPARIWGDLQYRSVQAVVDILDGEYVPQPIKADRLLRLSGGAVPKDAWGAPATPEQIEEIKRMRPLLEGKRGPRPRERGEDLAVISQFDASLKSPPASADMSSGGSSGEQCPPTGTATPDIDAASPATPSDPKTAYVAEIEAEVKETKTLARQNRSRPRFPRKTPSR
jgi:hypothetical protein